MNSPSKKDTFSSLGLSEDTDSLTQTLQDKSLESRRSARRPLNISRIIFDLVFLCGLITLGLAVRRMENRLMNPAPLTGWCLLGLMIFLSIFNARKKLAMLPLGKASFWLRLHVMGGFAAMIIFWFHSRVFWPQGFYEQAMTLLFYSVSVSGILGYLLQKIYPSRLTQTGIEMIYERIPAEIADIRQRAENLAIECTKKTGIETVGQHYLETFDWFFRKPRFFFFHFLGIAKADHWVSRHSEMVERYLNEEEKKYLKGIGELAELKNKVDLHFTLQTLMKGWLLVHIPIAVSLMMLIFWHVFLVHLYAV